MIGTEDSFVFGLGSGLGAAGGSVRTGAASGTGDLVASGGCVGPAGRVVSGAKCWRIPAGGTARLSLGGRDVECDRVEQHGGRAAIGGLDGLRAIPVGSIGLLLGCTAESLVLAISGSGTAGRRLNPTAPASSAMSQRAVRPARP